MAGATRRDAPAPEPQNAREGNGRTNQPSAVPPPVSQPRARHAQKRYNEVHGVHAGKGCQVLVMVRRCSTLVEAVRRAVQDLTPTIGLHKDDEQVSLELELKIEHYWGADHGMGPAELRSTARDIMAVALKR